MLISESMVNSNNTVTMQLIIIYGRTFYLPSLSYVTHHEVNLAKLGQPDSRFLLFSATTKAIALMDLAEKEKFSQYRINIKRHRTEGLGCLFWFCQLGNIAKFLSNPSCKWKWYYFFRVEFRVSPIFVTVKRFPRMSTCISCPCSLPFLIFYF